MSRIKNNALRRKTDPNRRREPKALNVAEFNAALNKALKARGLDTGYTADRILRSELTHTAASFNQQ